MAQMASEDSQSMSTMTHGPSFDPGSELTTPNHEYPTYPLRVRTVNDTHTLFTPERTKIHTEATLVASTSASATPVKAIPLVRKHTTKELISLYESASNTNTNTNYRNSNGVPKVPPAHNALVRSSKLNLNAPLPELPQSKPLRESFKNLLTVFGKKRVTKQKHAKSRSVSPSMGRPQPNLSNPAHGVISDVVLPSRTIGSVSAAPINKPASPSTLRSGTLLYCDTSTGDTLWHRCDALLAPPNLRLSWFTPSGRPATRTLSVAECRDARSAPASQQVSIAVPDSEGCSPYVFEVEFEGGKTERFAAQSLRTRGEWVSSIWDAILYSKGTFNRTYSPHDPLINLSRMEKARTPTLPGSGADPSSRALGEFLASAAIPAPQEVPKEPIASPARLPISFAPGPAPSPVPRQPPVKSVTPIQRQGTLEVSTPTPSQTTPAVPRRQATYANSRTPSTPPQRKLNCYSTSPSIKNLDRLSLVKQRLNTFDDSPERIKRTSREHSYFTPPRTPTGHRAHPDVTTEELPAPKDEPSGPGGSVDHNYRDPFEFTNAINSTSRESRADLPLFTLRNLPRQGSQTSLDLISVSTRLQPTENAESFYDNYMATNNSLEEIKGTIGDLKEDINSQGQTIGQLRDGIKEMHREVKLAIQQPPLPVPQLDDLRERMIAMAGGLHLVDVPGLHVKLDAMKDDLAAFDIAGIKTYLEELRVVTLANEPALSSELAGKLNSLAGKGDVEDVIFRLEQLQKEGLANIPLILEKVEALKQQVSAATERTTANIGVTGAPPTPVMDLSSVHAKLDTISALANSLMEQRKAPASPPPSAIPPPSVLRNLSVFKDAHKAPDLDSQLRSNEAAPKSSVSLDVLEILDLVKEDRDQRAVIANQFGDSVRYLNELNAWMESFVTNTYGSFQAMSTGVEQLCKELALPTDANPSKPDSIGTAIGDIRKLIEQGGQKQQQFEAIQTSVASLVQQVNTDLQQRAEANARQNQVLETLVSLLEKQRQDQEVLLHGVASALSADIRGERLRFVEAMQSATTVNVQLHIDEFKQQLAKEVTLMLQEVGRQLLGEAGNGAQQVLMAQGRVAQHQHMMHPNQYLHVPGIAAPLQHHPSNGSYVGRPLPSPRPSRRKA